MTKPDDNPDQSSGQPSVREDIEPPSAQAEHPREPLPLKDPDHSHERHGPPIPVAAPAGEQPKLPSGAIKPLESLRKYWVYGLIAALLVGAGGGFVYKKKKGLYTYTVMAKVRIAPGFSTVLTEQKETNLDSFQKWRQFQEQQAITIKRYDIVLAAIKSDRKSTRLNSSH